MASTSKILNYIRIQAFFMTLLLHIKEASNEGKQNALQDFKDAQQSESLLWNKPLQFNCCQCNCPSYFNDTLKLTCRINSTTVGAATYCFSLLRNMKPIVMSEAHTMICSLKSDGQKYFHKASCERLRDEGFDIAKFELVPSGHTSETELLGAEYQCETVSEEYQPANTYPTSNCYSSELEKLQDSYVTQTSVGLIFNQQLPSKYCQCNCPSFFKDTMKVTCQVNSTAFFGTAYILRLSKGCIGIVISQESRRQCYITPDGEEYFRKASCKYLKENAADIVELELVPSEQASVEDVSSSEYKCETYPEEETSMIGVTYPDPTPTCHHISQNDGHPATILVMFNNTDDADLICREQFGIQNEALNSAIQSTYGSLNEEECGTDSVFMATQRPIKSLHNFSSSCPMAADFSLRKKDICGLLLINYTASGFKKPKKVLQLWNCFLQNCSSITTSFLGVNYTLNSSLEHNGRYVRSSLWHVGKIGSLAALMCFSSKVNSRQEPVDQPNNIVAIPATVLGALAAALLTFCVFHHRKKIKDLLARLVSKCRRHVVVPQEEQPLNQH